MLPDFVPDGGEPSRDALVDGRCPLQRASCLLPMAAISLVALGGYAFTADQRSYYEDDFALRAWTVDHGWLGAYRDYQRCFGYIRPLGSLHILAWHRWLWDWPLLQQALMMTLHVAACLALFAWVRALCADIAAATAAALLLAAGHTYEGVVTWTSAGAGMLPAILLFLLSLTAYLRHLRLETRFGAWWAASFGLFCLSILFYDQHLGAAALFGLLALVTPCVTRRLRRGLGGLPFLVASAAVGLVQMHNAAQSTRPLEPSLRNVLAGAGVVLHEFWRLTLLKPLNDYKLRAGALAAVSEFLERDAWRLAGAIVTLVLGALAAGWVLQRRPASTPRTRHGLGLAVVGVSLTFVTLALMASQPHPLVHRRHTMFPALGLAMVVAALVYAARGLWTRRALAGLITAVALFASAYRLGYVYEWTTRARVQEAVLASLDVVQPPPTERDLLIIDGVRRYGQGFLNSWGLSSAYKLTRGTAVRIATILRCEGDTLVANGSWDVQSWPFDPSVARFFYWDARQRRLESSSFEAFVARNRQIHACAATTTAEPATFRPPNSAWTETLR